MTFDHFRKALGEALRNAKPAAITAEQRYCEECSKHHFIESFCPKCGACMCKNGKNLNDPMYPLWTCKKCGAGHLWD
jgi:hypothetical protein